MVDNQCDFYISRVGKNTIGYVYGSELGTSTTLLYMEELTENSHWTHRGVNKHIKYEVNKWQE